MRDAEELRMTPPSSSLRCPHVKFPPSPHFCNRKLVLPQGREGDGIKADCTFHTSHKRGTKLGQEESHCLLSSFGNTSLVGTKWEKKGAFFSLPL